jgi:hypothetical protein
MVSTSSAVEGDKVEGEAEPRIDIRIRRGLCKEAGKVALVGWSRTALIDGGAQPCIAGKVLA